MEVIPVELAHAVTRKRKGGERNPSSLSFPTFLIGNLAVIFRMDTRLREYDKQLKYSFVFLHHLNMRNPIFQIDIRYSDKPILRIERL